MRTQILSSDEWNAQKQFASEHEQRFLNVSLNEIGLTKNSFTENLVVIKGKPMSVSDKFLDDFLGACGLANFRKSLSKVDNGEISAQIFNSIRSAMNVNKEQYRIVVTPNNELSRLVSSNSARLSNKSVFDLGEHIANKYGLSVIEANTDLMGNSSIRLVTDQQVDLTGENNEIHRFGLSIKSEYGITKVDNFALRLVCTNGLETQDNFSHFDLKGISPQDLTDLFNHILTMQQSGFMPKGFAELVAKAKRTKASICETENVMSQILMRLGGLGEKNSDEYKMFKDRFCADYFPEYMYRKMELLGKGIQIDELTTEQKKYVHCGHTTIWDLVNILTNFGSNNLGMNVEQPKWLQIGGGKLLNSKHDLENEYIKLLYL